MRWFSWLLVLAWLAVGASAGADDREAASGYGASEPDYRYDVAHDGYGGVGRPVETAEPSTYVVVEADAGTTTEYEGETILVVKEPEPVAATSEAPPPPRVVPSDEVVIECPSGVWVHGYWHYRAGRYVWVDGHCVAVRVDYVFVAPRWDFYWDIWWFVPGYYRPCGVFVSYGYYRPWHWFPPYPHPYYRAGRGVPEFRGTPVRRTVARPVPAPRVPSVTRPPRHPTTVVHTPPSATRSFSRAGAAPARPGQAVRSRHGVDIVTEPRAVPQRTPDLRTPSSGRSRGLSRKRPRTSPSSSGSGWTPSSGSSSGSSKGWGGRRSGSSPSSGSSSGGSSSGRPSGGFGGKHK